MENLIRIVAVTMTLALPAATVLGDTVESKATEDAYMRWNDGTTFVEKTSMKAGNNNTVCFSFDGLGALNKTQINDAQLEVHCKSCSKRNVLVNVCGEYGTDPAPLSETPFDLQRMWTRACSTLDIGRGPNRDWLPPIDVESALQEVVDQDGWSGRVNLCILPAGGRATHTLDSQETNAPSEGEYGANLLVDFTVPSEGGGGGGGVLGPCFSQDTNDDSFLDVEFGNNDGDTDVDGREICDLPVGTVDISGILTLDGAFEVPGTVAEQGVTLRRGLINVAKDARIISDFMSPTVTIPETLDTVTLEFLADGPVSIGPDALISNLGLPGGEHAGPLLVTTKFPNTSVTFKSSSIAARNIDVESKAIAVEGASVFAAFSDIKFTAEDDGDITVSGDTAIFAGVGRELIFTTAQGNVTIGENALIVGDVDACGVAGEFKTDNPAVAPQDIIFGNVRSNDLANCDPPPVP